MRTVTICSREAPLQATFVPGAGMLCCSLRHDGAELLARRAGVRAYAERGSTMGIPLLYPWANRLAGFSYRAARGAKAADGAGVDHAESARGADAVVELPRKSPLLKLDEHGLPIHGVIPGGLAWELLDGADARAPERLHARMRWQRPELLEIFPYVHTVELRARLERATLTIETEVHADDRAVPVSFGYHPYLSPPEGERGAWEVRLPVRERLQLDGEMIPTGAREPFEPRSFALGETGWDDAFAGLIEPPVFSLTAAERRIELELLSGYSFAQLYAPSGESFACFEPMTAPTNALRSGDGLRFADPGEPFRAAFRISVSTALER
jgi:galactose mutarotase-like enzyme